MDLTEAEDIKKRWQKYTEDYTKVILYIIILYILYIMSYMSIMSIAILYIYITLYIIYIMNQGERWLRGTGAALWRYPTSKVRETQ